MKILSNANGYITIRLLVGEAREIVAEAENLAEQIPSYPLLPNKKHLIRLASNNPEFIMPGLIDLTKLLKQETDLTDK